MSLSCEIRNLIEHYEDLVDCLNRAIGCAVDHQHSIDAEKLTMRKMTYERDMIPDLKKLLEIAEAGKKSYLPEGDGK